MHVRSASPLILLCLPRLVCLIFLVTAGPPRRRLSIEKVQLPAVRLAVTLDVKPVDIGRYVLWCFAELLREDMRRRILQDDYFGPALFRLAELFKSGQVFSAWLCPYGLRPSHDRNNNPSLRSVQASSGRALSPV